MYPIKGLRYWFLEWCGFNLYSTLAIRWCCVGNLALACEFCIKNTHHWRSNHLTGYIWNLFAYITIQLATDVLGVFWFGRLWPSVAQACKMTIYLTISALVLSCRTLKTFYVIWITTLGTTIYSLMSLVCIIFFPVGQSLIFVFT